MIQEDSIALKLPQNNYFDPNSVDLDLFLNDINNLKKEVEDNLGDDDIKHLKKIYRIGQFFSILGLATSWIAPNPISAISLALGKSNKWIMMHHIGHRGYDKVPNVPAKYHSSNFAKGYRRYIDWFDWMMPEAWKYEHNVLHHSYTGELRDPDLVERNSEKLRNSDLPRLVKYGLIGLLGIGWKPYYYVPNTTQALHDRDFAEDKNEIVGGKVTYNQIWKDLVFKCYLPYGLFNFIVLPLLFLPLSIWASFSVFFNVLLSELITNFHTFMIIGPNHTGDDIYRFNSKPKNKAERYLRQIIGSANCKTGGDFNDFLHGWLNYQIEHHVFPDIPMLKYQQIQPKIKEICEKHNIPYVQESIFSRFKKMAEVAVGKNSMRNLY